MPYYPPSGGGGGSPAILVETGSAEKVSAMTAASSVGATDLIPIVQGGVNKSATPGLIAGGALANPITYTGNPNNLNIVVFQAGQLINGVFVAGLMASQVPNTSGLSILDFGTVELIQVDANFNFGGTSLLFPSLRMSLGFGGSWDSVTTLDLSSLEIILDFSPTINALTSLSFPACTQFGGYFSATSLTSLSLSVWETDGPDSPGPDGFGPSVPSLAQAQSWSSLQHLDGGLSGTWTLVPSFNLPAIITLNGGVNVTTAAACTSFTLGSTLKSVGVSGAANFIFTGAALTQASVDGILARLASLDGTGGTTTFQNATVNLSGGTSATPSAAGLVSKATLTGRGCTVTTN